MGCSASIHGKDVPGHAATALKATIERLEQEVVSRQQAAEARAPKDSFWSLYGGPFFAGMMAHTTFLSIHWLVARARYLQDLPRKQRLGQGLPRCQDLPPEAILNSVDELETWSWLNHFGSRNRSLPIIILSYCWLDAEHPDKYSDQLIRLLPIFEAFASHGTCAVIIDYCSLPQHPRISIEEQARFTLGIRSINEWYAHQHTFVLVLHELPQQPEGLAPYANLTPYLARGWPYFERCISSLVKVSWCLLDVSRWSVGEKANDLEEVKKVCRRESRDAPLSPATFKAILERDVTHGTKRFTKGADLGLVTTQYEIGFRKQMAIVSIFSLSRIGWGDAELCTFIDALKWAHADGQLRALKSIVMNDNCFGADGLKAFAKFLQEDDAVPLLSEVIVQPSRDEQNTIGNPSNAEEGWRALEDVCHMRKLERVKLR